VKAIVQLALKAPLELRMVQIPRVKLEIIGVHWKLGILELDDDLDRLALGAGVEDKQRVLVEPKLGLYAFEAWICGHGK